MEDHLKVTKIPRAQAERKILPFLGKHLSFILLLGVLLVFTISAAYFAINLKRNITPDETSHIYISNLFSSTFGIPQYTERSLKFGYSELDRMPFLYFWLNGRILNGLNIIVPGIEEWPQIQFLRFTSVLYSMFTLIYGYLLTKEITASKWWPLLTTFMMANTLMFTFLSGGVTYDNISNLCAIAGIYYLVRVLSGKPFTANSLAWLAFIATGVMLKITIFPLAFITGAIWLFYFLKHLKNLRIFFPVNWSNILMAVYSIVMLALITSVFGVNVFSYHRLTPSCERVLSVELCSNSFTAEREKNLPIPEKKLTIADAVEDYSLGPWTYLVDYWTGIMTAKTYGIMGHQSYYNPYTISLLRIFYAIVVVLFIRFWRFDNRTLLPLLIILLGYSLVLFGLSYNSELETGFLHVGIQGRYIFPVLGILYALVVYLLSRLQNRILQRVMIGFILLSFFAAGPVPFLLHFAKISAISMFL